MQIFLAQVLLILAATIKTPLFILLTSLSPTKHNHKQSEMYPK